MAQSIKSRTATDCTPVPFFCSRRPLQPPQSPAPPAPPASPASRMTMWKILLLLLTTICAAVPLEYNIGSSGPSYIAHGGPKEYYSHPKYQFSYGVEDRHTGDVKSQEEQRDGDAVKGYYTLHEADGTTRTVHYTADKHSGFNAVVERTGHAQHPQVQHVVKALVAAPAPVLARPQYAFVPALATGPAVKATLLAPVVASYLPRPAPAAQEPPHGYRTTIGLGAFRSSGYYH